MGTKTQSPTPTPLSRLSRFGLGLGLKSAASSPPSPPRRAKDNEDWYIPYNGPYEPAPQRAPARQRDSWGDLIPADDDPDPFAPHRDILTRFAPPADDASSYPHHRSSQSNHGHPQSQTQSSARSRALSGLSQSTRSSAQLDPSRKSTTARQSAAAASSPTYSKLDGAGGVGESPLPVGRSRAATVSAPGARVSFASIFNFGPSPAAPAPVRKAPPPPVGTSWPHNALDAAPSRAGARSAPAPVQSAYAVPQESDEAEYAYYPASAASTASRNGAVRPKRSSPDVQPSPASSYRPSSSSHNHPSPQIRAGTQLQHPYAAAAPVPVTPMTAPPLTHSHSASYASKGKARMLYPETEHEQARDPYLYHEHGRPDDNPLSAPAVRVTMSDRTHPDSDRLHPSSPKGSLLKTSVSTPNLRGTARQQAQPSKRDRWLSAETWCDALLFPRPRFKMKQAALEPPPRLMSPPPEVISADAPTHGRKPSRPSMQSRTTSTRSVSKLKKARSTADIGAAAQPAPPPPSKFNSFPASDPIPYNHPVRGPASTTLVNAPAYPRSSTYHGSAAPVPLSPTGVEQVQARARMPRLEEATSVLEQQEEAEAARFKGNALPASYFGTSSTVPPPSSFDPTRADRVRKNRYSWDDMVLPSPVPSLARVLEDGERLERERKAWQSQATGSLLNNRTRDLSRTRAKSLTKTHHRLRGRDQPSDAEVSNFDFLAARTMLGTQGIVPTVNVVRFAPSSNTNSTGTRSDATHSRSHSHSSAQTTSASRHTRSDSLGRGLKAAKRTAALCGFGMQEALISPEDERSVARDFQLPTGGTRVIHLDEQRKAALEPRLTVLGSSSPESAASAALAMVTANGGSQSPTPSNSREGGVGMGIALSSPPASASDHPQPGHVPPPVQMIDHPYAMANGTASSRVPRQTAVLPSAADMAVGAGIGMSNIAARHRLPPQASLAPVPHIVHPYASGGGPRTSGIDVHSPAARAMWAQVGSGVVREVLPDEIRYSPMPLENPAFADKHAPEHAYAYRQDPGDDQTLRMADALSIVLRRRRSADSELMPMPMQDAEHHMLASADVGQEGVVEADVNRLPDSTPKQASSLSPASPLSPRVRRKPVQFDDVPPTSKLAMPALEQRRTERSQLSLPLSNRTMASSPSDHINPPDFRPSLRVDTPVNRRDGSGSSPGAASEGTSPPLSPRRLASSSSDDLDRFRGLFYEDPATSPEAEKKGASAVAVVEAAKAAAAARRKPSREAVPVDVSPHSTVSSAALTSLTRQLGNELLELRRRHPESASDASSSFAWSRHFGSGSVDREAVDHLEDMLAQVSSGTLPTRALFAGKEPSGPSLSQVAVENVPEDVQSSRASSPLEHPAEVDEAHPMRFGAIEAVATPPAVETSHRRSGHLSFIESEPHSLQAALGGPGRASVSSRGGRASASSQAQSGRDRAVSSTSLGVPSSGVTRSSYMTSTSDGSLSDFPQPPAALTPAHMDIIQSYFAGHTPSAATAAVEDPLARAGRADAKSNAVRARRRQTFGQEAPEDPDEPSLI